MAFKARHRYIVSKTAETFGLDEAFAETELRREENLNQLSAFFRSDGPRKLFVYFQPHDELNEQNEAVPGEGDAELFVTDGHQEALRRKALFFLRVRDNEGRVGDLDASRADDGKVAFGVVHPEALRALEALMAQVHRPLLLERGDWGRAGSDHVRDFRASLDKYIDGLSGAMKSLGSGLELARPDKSLEIDRLPFAELVSSPRVIFACVKLLDVWCVETERFLEDSDQTRWDNGDKGPVSELEYWRRRLGELTSITEQLKRKDNKLVVMVLGAVTKSTTESEMPKQQIFSLLRRWKQVDLAITEAANEAKDNVRYLATLEKFFATLYEGTPDNIIDTLPALMNSIKMIHTIARYYNTTERMTNLFVKITNQMIENCKHHISQGEQGSAALWDMAPEDLLERLEACLRLNEAYQEQYRVTKDKLLAMPKGKQFDFSEAQIFGKYDLFCRRIIKLIDMFSTIHQFQALRQHHLEGMEDLLASFDEIIQDFQSQQHDLLAFHENRFDRAYVEFNVRISDLEASLQRFINESFESITSIDQSLALLRKFQSLLQRDSLKQDLDSKFLVIFHRFGMDLGTVSELYEKFKHVPPVPRNMPPVAGSIMWARHLLHRVEGPMKKFSAHPSVLQSKESRKIVKTFNKVARTLVAFEYLWFEEWCRNIDKAKAGLQATLIIRHPATGRLYVNFDSEILQLIREAKCLDRLGIEIPESARMVLLQEDKFKTYHDELTFLLSYYDQVVRKILPSCAVLLRPHVADLEFKLRPGMITLTWTSMNIDAFRHHVYSGLQKLEALVMSVNDIIENRIEKNLKTVSRTVLVDLPADKSMLLEEFVNSQEQHVRDKTEALQAKNQEVENAVDDLFTLITSYPLDPHVGEVDPEEIYRVKTKYNNLFFQALRNSTANSLNAVKKRICARSGTGFLFLERPFFEVAVQLAVPSVSLNPNLDDIQRTINKAALAVLRCSQMVDDWGQQHLARGSRRAFFERIGRDIEIVRVVLMLTGGVQGTRNQVSTYLGTFHKYDWLWKEDKELAYRRFMQTQPQIEDFERELRRFVGIEDEIASIPPMHNIGALTLNTKNLKLQLRSECREWRVQYSRRVHEMARGRMEELHEYISKTSAKLSRDVQTLDDLRFVMSVLKEVRERESSIEMEITPIVEMYDILDRFLPSGFMTKEEMDKRSVMRSLWRKLVDSAESVADMLSGIQGTFKRQLMRDVRTFSQECSSFKKDYNKNGPARDGLRPAQAVEALKRFKTEFEIRQRKMEAYQAGEELFALPKTEYPELMQIKKQLELLDMLYSLYMDVVTTMDEYREVPWASVVASIDSMTDRVSSFDLRCRKLPARLREWEAFTELRSLINAFSDVLPLLQELSKESIKPRHWRDMEKITGREFAVEGGEFKLSMLLDAELHLHKEDIEELAEAADKQLEIEQRLATLRDQWAATDFNFGRWQNRDKVPVLKGYGGVLENLEESILQLQTMLSMRHVGPFKDVVMQRFVELSNTVETLERWVRVQMLWCSLESVFTGGDIAKQMPLEAKKFSKIDKEFTKLMLKAEDTKNVVQCCSNEVLRTTLPTLFEELERCQKSLEGYLEQKRQKFPRFYFCSNPVLLQILSQGSDPQAIQQYYEKLFDSINRAVHDRKDKAMIVEMKTLMGRDEEVVPLATPVKAHGNIEDWLTVLEGEMQRTMKRVCAQCAQEWPRGGEKDGLSSELVPFVERYCGQFALLGLQLKWTDEVESALLRCRQNKSLMVEAMYTQNEVLKTLSAECLKDLGSRMKRVKFETLVTIQVHQVEVLRHLLGLFRRNAISDPNDFEWLKQSRFRWSPTDSDRHGKGACVISITDVDFKYQFEYLGCKERLVITPLTDRCYITLAQALGMYLGGAPAGPAGTGKTETVKDMGRSLGTYVVVTNCTDQQRKADMAKIFKGLCQAGLWGCFDEFNRILLPVLSVIAQQVQAIIAAKRSASATVMFPGEEEPLQQKNNVGIFITMNPGYAGRQNLPENLKALFRTVAMMVPDREIIMRVKLSAVGYENYELLAKKFRTLYRLSEQQLSAQKHYDFGLRNILSVLRTAGKTKRENQRENEEMLLMRTLRDMNLSKLVAQDVPLFLSLLNDLFPNVSNPPAREFPALVDALHDVVNQRGLVAHSAWLAKVMQLYETMLVRHGVMVVGPSGGGKSTIFRTLATAMQRISDPQVPHKIATMNPKSILAHEMFGSIDKASGEWLDGVFAAMWAKYNDRSRKVMQFLICDGPIDTLWIENLNTVLDDNKILTLANGDRIPMTDNVKLMFEAEDLRNASPATVSRAGIIYVSAEDLDWLPVAEGWVRRQAENMQGPLRSAFEKYIGTNSKTEIGELFRWLSRNSTPVMETTRVAAISAMTNLLSSLLKRTSNSFSDVPSTMEDQLERLFLYSLAWGIGGLLDPEDRSKFDKMLRTKLTAGAMHKKAPGKTPMPIAVEGGTIFDYFVDEQLLTWRQWEAPHWEYPDAPKLDFARLLVPTVDSTRAIYLLSAMHERNLPVLLVGAPGTAKTSTALMFFDSFDSETMLLKKVHFSALTTAGMLQSTVESEMDKRGGRSFGPPQGKEMTLFLDDLSMPEQNEWGDQPTLENVRQLMERGGFCFLEKDKRGDFKVIEDLRFVAAMNRPGGGRQDIANRLKRHFFAFNMPLPSITSVDNIYGQMIQGRFGSGVSSGVLDMAKKLTMMTIKLWTWVKRSFLPTPAKFHYVFNMRELSRVFQGVFRADQGVLRDEATLLSLWRHECCRVFSDKLTSNEDKRKFSKQLDDITIHHGGKKALQDLNLAERPETFFVDFLHDDEYDADGVFQAERQLEYEPVESLTAVRARVSEFMHIYNTENPSKRLDLVLFDDALRHLMRISRVLAMPRGNALLVGVGGSGKQSLTRLAAFVCKQEFFQLSITKSYNANNLLEDFQDLYKMAGADGKQVCFAFTDTQIKDETFLEHINAVLTTGEVTNLFPKDEFMVMCSDLRGPASKERTDFADTPDFLGKFFIDRVRSNLHLVLCMSPMNKLFAERARKFPGLTGSTQIDWFLPWPKEALTAVAEGFIADFPIECDAKEKVQLMHHMGAVHAMVVETCEEYYASLRRRVYQTPKSFLSFVDSYKALYRKKLSDVRDKESRVNLGLQKLVKGAEDVEHMKIQLAEEEVKLKDAEVATNEMLGKLEVSSLEAKKENEKVEKIKDHCEAEAGRIAQEKSDAEEDLARAKPFLEEAERAVDSIQPSDLVELKALSKPSDIIRLVFDGVAILKMFPVIPVKVTSMTFRIGRDKKTMPFLTDSYTMNKTTMINDTGFLKSLFHFSHHLKDSINDETVELLKPYTECEGFLPSVARAASRAAEGLCVWVRAMVSYHEASKIVKPKLEALRMAEKKLEKAESDLAGAEARLDRCRELLDSLQSDFEHQMAEKQAIADNATKTRNRMEQATKLISGLAGERVRWSEDSTQFANMKRRLVGDCALAAAFLSYGGAFNQDFRRRLVDSSFRPDLVRRRVSVSKEVNLVEFLVDAGTVGDWNMQGLPTDLLSIQNGILVTKSDRFPLLIDPQGQALAWIRKREAEALPSFGVTTINHPKLRDHLEFAMGEGKALVVVGVEQDVDPMLNPVLEKQVTRRGKSNYINVSDKWMELNDDFRLYLTTRLPNPHFSPELQARTTVVDFAVTLRGLEEQLLGRVIQKEQSSLEEQLKNVLEEVTANTKALLKLDAMLLERLTENEGNLLDDVELISVLGNTKEKATEVNEKLKTARETKLAINEKREQFRPVATRGSVLYFAIVDMTKVNPMYQTSLDQFLDLFTRSMDEAEKATLASKRVDNIIKAMTYIVYRYINRGLYERDRLSFVLICALKIMVVAGRLRTADVDALLKGGALLDVNEVRRKPFAWMPPAAWLNVIQLAKSVPFFAHLPDELARGEAVWKRWFEDNEPETIPVPDYEGKLASELEVGAFYRLQLVRALREDRTILAVTDFLRSFETVLTKTGTLSGLGRDYVAPVTDTLESVVKEMAPYIPVVFLLSAGSDPTDGIENLARRRKQAVDSVSMGEGQDIVAKRAIENAVVNGTWVLLQNCHLDLRFMAKIEDMLPSFREEANPEMRIFITADPHPEFPIGLLQSGLKVTNEPPNGMRAGMLRSYNTMIDQDKLERIDSDKWRKLLFAMCFLHSTAQERRKFGPLGWCVPYEFNAGDLNACLVFLEKHMYTGTISWDTLQYMVGEVHYGGRVTDDMDRRLLKTYAKTWLSESTVNAGFTFILGDPVARIPNDFVYSIPDGQEVDFYRSFIASFPDIDSPEVFGLHPNADLTFRVKEVTQLLRTILETLPKENTSSGGMTREDIALEKAGELLSRLPPQYVTDEYESRITAMGGLEIPLNMFLYQEVQRMQKVVESTHTTLSVLSQAIRGEVVMTAELQRTVNSIVDGLPPRQFVFNASGEEVSWLAQALGSWFTGLLDRDAQLRSWLSDGRPTCYWMTGFFNPQGFLTAMRQEVTRRHAADKWSLDDIVYYAEVTDYERPEQVRTARKEGVLLHGLFLDGAVWSKADHQLAESPPKQLFSPMPVVYVTAVTTAQLHTKMGNYGVGAGVVQVPVYKYQRRTDAHLILEIPLPCSHSANHWILRGVAVLCSAEQV